ncbi:MAG: site-specific integrase [Defluviitaleaceae bacterium]|nr:site-specific integrase [Defluviitaleaceae bacterium]
MKTTDFAECLSTYLTMYLPGEAGLSGNTIMSYRDTFKLVLLFAKEQRGLSPEKITLNEFNSGFTATFLSWLEENRVCSTSTRNNRLAALRAFAKYVSLRKPEYIWEYQKILDLRFKKNPQPLLMHLTPDMVKAIMAQPDVGNSYGRRDLALLSLMYDAAARVQEICDMCVGNVRLQKPYAVILTGKGGKARAVPIMASTADVLTKYVSENRLDEPSRTDYPLFFNHQRHKLTRAGITYILKKYSDAARKQYPGLQKRISPHVMRHSKAMHLLQSGVNLVYIRDFLGHVHVETTEVYAKADTEMRRKSIEQAQIRIDAELPSWNSDKSLMEMLVSLCGKE